MRESDWKKLRTLKVVALDRLCASALGEIAAIVSASEQSNHERFLAAYQRIHERNDDIAEAFDDLRRSTAEQRLAAMYAQGLVTQEELSEFSEETRVSVQFLATTLYKS